MLFANHADAIRASNVLRANCGFLSHGSPYCVRTKVVVYDTYPLVLRNKNMKSPRSKLIAIPATKEQLSAIAAGKDSALDIIGLRTRFGFKSDATIYSLVRKGVL